MYVLSKPKIVPCGNASISRWITKFISVSVNGTAVLELIKYTSVNFKTLYGNRLNMITYWAIMHITTIWVSQKISKHVVVFCVYVCMHPVEVTLKHTDIIL